MNRHHVHVRDSWSLVATVTTKTETQGCAQFSHGQVDPDGTLEDTHTRAQHCVLVPTVRDKKPTALLSTSLEAIIISFPKSQEIKQQYCYS